MKRWGGGGGGAIETLGKIGLLKRNGIFQIHWTLRKLEVGYNGLFQIQWFQRTLN